MFFEYLDVLPTTPPPTTISTPPPPTTTTTPPPPTTQRITTIKKTKPVVPDNPGEQVSEGANSTPPSTMGNIQNIQPYNGKNNGESPDKSK
jgi:hypothetical protein